MESGKRSQLFSNWTSQLVTVTQLKGKCDCILSEHETATKETIEIQRKLTNVMNNFKWLYDETCQAIVSALEPLNLQAIKILSTNSKITNEIRGQIESIYVKIDELCFDMERIKHNCNLNITAMEELVTILNKRTDSSSYGNNEHVSDSNEMNLHENNYRVLLNDIKSSINTIVNCHSRANFIRDKCGLILNQNMIEACPQTMEYLISSIEEKARNENDNSNECELKVELPQTSPSFSVPYNASPVPPSESGGNENEKITGKPMTPMAPMTPITKSQAIQRVFNRNHVLSPSIDALKSKVYKSHHRVSQSQSQKSTKRGKSQRSLVNVLKGASPHKLNLNQQCSIDSYYSEDCHNSNYQDATRDNERMMVSTRNSMVSNDSSDQKYDLIVTPYHCHVDKGEMNDDDDDSYDGTHGGDESNHMMHATLYQTMGSDIESIVTPIAAGAGGDGGENAGNHTILNELNMPYHAQLEMSQAGQGYEARKVEETDNDVAGATSHDNIDNKQMDNVLKDKKRQERDQSQHIGLEQVSMYEDFENNVIRLRARTTAEVEKHMSFHDTPDDNEPGSFIAAVISMTKGLIGVAILTLPCALAKGSIFFGTMILLLCCFSSCFTFILLAEMCSYTDHYSLMQLWRAAFPYDDSENIDATSKGNIKWNKYISEYGSIFVEFINFVNPFTCLIAFMNIVGTTFNAPYFETLLMKISKEYIILIVLLFTTFPLCMMKNINSKPMTIAGFIGTMSAVFLPIAIMNHENFDEMDEKSLNLNWIITSLNGEKFWDIAFVFGLINVACSAHHNAPRYFEEFSRNREKKESIKLFRIAALISFGIALIFYFSTAMFAYIVFSDGNNKDDTNIKNNIMHHFHESTRFCGVVLNIWFLINALVTIPHHFHAARRSYYNLIREFNVIPKSLTNDKLYNSVNWWIVSCVIFFIVYILGALIFKDLAIITAWRGATSNILLIYIFPTLIFLRLKSKTFENKVVGYNKFQEKKAYMLSKALKQKLITLPEFDPENPKDYNNNNNENENENVNENETGHRNTVTMKLKRKSKSKSKSKHGTNMIASASHLSLTMDEDMDEERDGTPRFGKHKSDYKSDIQMVHSKFREVSRDEAPKNETYSSIHSILMNSSQQASNNTSSYATPMCSSPDILMKPRRESRDDEANKYKDRSEEKEPKQQKQKQKIVIRKIKKPKIDKKKWIIYGVLLIGIFSGICGIAAAIRKTFF